MNTLPEHSQTYIDICKQILFTICTHVIHTLTLSLQGFEMKCDCVESPTVIWWVQCLSLLQGPVRAHSLWVERVTTGAHFTIHSTLQPENSMEWTQLEGNSVQ